MRISPTKSGPARAPKLTNICNIFKYLALIRPKASESSESRPVCSIPALNPTKNSKTSTTIRLVCNKEIPNKLNNKNKEENVNNRRAL
ncbi:unnamed protein product [marine sediment metagenome]|uniref:Uncharacterized protein n=1 Tax=marine sediment metagenome TaxID=412755 RepID=X0ZAJ4_9ZZZZ